jgi:hypothetical protein
MKKQITNDMIGTTLDLYVQIDFAGERESKYHNLKGLVIRGQFGKPELVAQSPMHPNRVMKLGSVNDSLTFNSGENAWEAKHQGDYQKGVTTYQLAMEQGLADII